MALQQVDRNKLAKLLNLLGSNHADERDAAGLAALRLLQQRGISWQEALEPAPITKALPELGTWRQTVARCLERPGSLRPWEVGFLRDLPGFHRLSTKQRDVLKKIADRVLCRESAR
jgi:hypothetical protein